MISLKRGIGVSVSWKVLVAKLHARVAEDGRPRARRAVIREHVFRPEHSWAGLGQDLPRNFATGVGVAAGHCSSRFSHASHALKSNGRPRKSRSSSAAGFEPPAARIASRYL